MQSTQAGSSTSHIGVTENNITFRSSPNFLNMKKFLKNRTELNNVASTSAMVTNQEEPNEVTPALLVQPGQPPLPPYPPPPDSPSILGMFIKTERQDIEDTPDNYLNSETTSEEPEHIAAEDQGDNLDNPKRPMCKQFIRGFCNRPVCKYEHKMDLSQLRGVFIFCKDYQNTVCKFPKCRYVHADIFEEAEFYRTGILPAHARRHQKNVLPPPPPPEEIPLWQQPDASIRFPYPPPPPPSGTLIRFSTEYGDVFRFQAPLPRRTSPPASSSSAQPGEDVFRFQAPLPHSASASTISAQPGEDVFRFQAALPRSTSPLQRDWNVPENVSILPRERGPDTDSVAKQCKNCEMMAFRVQYNKKKVDDEMESMEEFKTQFSALRKKGNRLLSVLFVLQQGNSNDSGGISDGVINEGGLHNNMNFSGNGFDGFDLSNMMRLFCNIGDQAMDTTS